MENQNVNNTDKDLNVDKGGKESEVMMDEAVSSVKESAGDDKNNLGPQEALGKDLELFKQRYYYLAAEFENYKKRVEKEKESLVKFGYEKILMDLLGVIDNFERTLEVLKKSEDEKSKNIVVGIDMIQKQLLAQLKKYGLEVVNAVGKEFDPNLHEAVSKAVKNDCDEETVLEEYQKGYTLHQRLLRPSKVVVSMKAES
jgi:molecular chaperone GrpE